MSTGQRAVNALWLVSKGRAFLVPLVDERVGGWISLAGMSALEWSR